MTNPAHIMVDLETLGTKPGCAILSIGAVPFDPVAGTIDMANYFYVNIDRASAEALGLIVDPDAVAWWEMQSDEAKAALAHDPRDLPTALDLFSNWRAQLGSDRLTRFWANDPDFDGVILSAAYEAIKVVRPWHYNAARSCRTMTELSGIKPDRTNGTHHNALDDAVTQARAVIAAYAKLGLAQGGEGEPVSDPYKLAREAISNLIEWDQQTGFRVPYRVRDPLISALSSIQPLSKPQKLPEAPKVEQEPFGYAYETIGGDWVLRPGATIGDTGGKPLYTRPAPASEALWAAVEGIDADYMTSDTHHPGHVLIPTTKFDAIVAALESAPKVERGLVARLSAVAHGAKIEEVYGSEWCADPALTFRAELASILSVPAPSSDARVISCEEAHATAVEMGYASLTEALEDLEGLQKDRNAFDGLGDSAPVSDELLEALKPFAELSRKFAGSSVVEVCIPTPANPSTHIQPLLVSALDYAAEVYAKHKGPQS